MQAQRSFCWTAPGSRSGREDTNRPLLNMPSTLTVGQYKTEIRSAFGNRVDADARLGIILAMAQDSLARLHDFDELRQRTTIPCVITGSAANDKIVSITTLGRYRTLYDIRLFATNHIDRKLRKILPRRWDKIVPKAEYYSRGTPSIYMVWKRDEIELWRVPDIAYDMHFRYTIWPAVVGADGTTLTLENVDELIILLSCSYLALSLGHLSRSNEFYRAFANKAADAFLEDVDDYDTHMAVHGNEVSNVGTLGYNDPFQRSMP